MDSNAKSRAGKVSRIDYRELTARLIGTVDVVAHYKSLNVRFATTTPNDAGWVKAYRDDEDRNPSAAVNVSKREKDWGRWKDFSTGESKSLWDFTIEHTAKYGKTVGAVKLALATELNVEVPRTGQAGANGRADGDKNKLPLVLTKWSNASAARYCRVKPGVTPEALAAAGAKMGLYPRFGHQQDVLAFPTLDAAGKQLGWHLAAVNGNPIIVRHKDGSTTEGKTITLTAAGLLNAAGVDKLAEAKVVWKAEGLSDCLALQAVAPPDVAVVGTTGAADKPKPDAVEALAGRTVYVVHDADEAGQNGARPWIAALAGKADVRNVILTTHDVRDFLNEKGYDALAALAEAAPAEEPPAPGHEGVSLPPGVRPRDHDDPIWWSDRFRQLHRGGKGESGIWFYRQEWYIWDMRCYVKYSDDEARDRLVGFIRAAIDSELITTCIGKDGDGEEIRAPKTIVTQFASNVAMNLRAACLLESETKAPSMLGKPDAGRNYVTLDNGILNVDAWMANDPNAFTGHTPHWFSTVVLPYGYDPAAACPTWKRVVGEILENDAARVALLQEWMGYMLTWSTGKQKFLIMVGEGGNGKSVVIAVMTAVLGEDNVSNVPLECFGERFQLANTLGKLANIVSEVGFLDKVAEGRLKEFTSGASMFFDRKGIAGINTPPTARLVLATNNLPEFSDRSRGIWRRMILMPFQIEIAEEKQVEDMDKATWWLKGGELPGIFNWALAGLRRLHEQKRFTEPELCAAALEEYQTASNNARQFLAEKCRPEKGFNARGSMLYAAYRTWCERQGYKDKKIMTSGNFGKEVHRMFEGVVRKQIQVNGVRDWHYLDIHYASNGFEAKEEGEPPPLEL
jgi:P4 family phage/plasmid primase-like protien